MDTRKQYLYTMKPTRLGMLSDGGTHEESNVLSQHYAHLQRLANEGTVVMAGQTLTTGPETFGIVILYAQDEDEAQSLMAADPAIAREVMQAELFPYGIALVAET